VTEETLSERIFAAQCLGNVEPIEHMVPYPNLPSLLEGQTIKQGAACVYAQGNITNQAFFNWACQTATWLKEQGIRTGDRIYLPPLPFPQAEILAFSAWIIGASILIVGGENPAQALRQVNPKLRLSRNWDLFTAIKDKVSHYEPDSSIQLTDEAVVYWEDGRGIRLSHYNLLVNTNGLQHALDLYEDRTFLVQLPQTTTAWVVLQVLLPFYTGACLTDHNPDLTLSLPDQFDSPNYIIDLHWSTIKASDPPHLFILPENTAILSIGTEPVHLTNVEGTERPLKIEGHSVMMGYLDDSWNEVAFRDGMLLVE
jgi:hypothetical protein